MKWRCEAAFAAALVIATWSDASWAYFGEDTEHPQITDRGAYTVPAGMHKISLFSVEYGLHDQFQMITYPFWWQLFAPNVGLEWQFIRQERWSMSLGLQGMYFSTRPFRWFFPDLPVADAGIIPVDLAASVRLTEDWSMHMGSLLTFVIVSGRLDEDDLQGAAALSNLQQHLTLEWRISRVVALLLHGRYQVAQQTKAGADAELQLDEFTTIRAAALAESDVLDFPNAFQIVPSVQFSWETFNLRLGLGYGNNVIPTVNFVLPKRTLVPDFAMYWRF
jgi:hypothetical protein